MCGIFGVLNTSGLKKSEKSAHKSFFSTLQHRGPDDSGEYSDEKISLGMVRLSIIDLNLGKQPFWSSDESIGIFANGEIYNYIELREELIRSGTQFKSSCDLEVIAHLYEKHGLSFVSHLRGMYAIVILDNRSNVVHLIRDPVGEKPLYISTSKNGFVFSSELKSLIQSGGVSLKFDPQMIGEYLKYGFVPEPFTLISGIRKIEPGTIESYCRDTGARSVWKFWDLNNISEAPKISSSELRLTINEVVRITSRSEVPVGLALSGGLDSSILASLMLKQRVAFESITVGYSDKIDTDETALAREYAEELGIKSHFLKISPSDVGAGFMELCTKCDEPIADISGYSYLSLAKFSHSKGLKVLITGQGADELFWGYEWARNAASRLEYRLKFSGTFKSYWKYFGLERMPKRLGPFVDWVKSGAGVLNRLDELAADLPQRNSHLKRVDVYRYFPRSRTKQRLITKLIVQDSKNTYCEIGSHSRDSGTIVARTLFNTYLRSNGLAQVDRLTMSASVEARSPFVDLRLVELAYSQLNESNSFGFEPKAFLKDAVLDIIPKKIIGRSKAGFTPPVLEWYEEIYRQNKASFEKPRIVALGLVNQRAVKVLNKPQSLTRRPMPLWYELAVLEGWVRSMESLKIELD